MIAANDENRRDEQSTPQQRIMELYEQIQKNVEELKNAVKNSKRKRLVNS